MEYEINPVHEQPYEISRRQLLAGSTLAALTFGATKVTNFLYPEVRPHGPAHPKSESLPENYYSEPLVHTNESFYKTIHSQQSHQQFQDNVMASEATEELELLGNKILNRYSGDFVIGRTNYLTDWLSYASSIASRKYNRTVPANFIKVEFNRPTIEHSKQSLLQISDTFGAIPTEIISETGVGEQAIVDKLSIRSGIPLLAQKEISINGASDLKSFNLVETTDNQQSGNLRRVGRGMLSRLAMIIDRRNVGTEDTFDDVGYHSLRFPETPPDQLQEYLNNPSMYENNIAEVSISKRDRITELLTGGLITLGHREYGSLRQKQQALMLERLQATYPQVSVDYYKQLSIARQKLGHTPRFSEEIKL